MATDAPQHASAPAAASVEGLLVDPSLADGSKVVYDREVSMEVRQTEEEHQDLGQLQLIKCKILVQGEETKPQSVRIEVCSDADLFFHYYHTLNLEGYREMQGRQKLMVNFCDYPTVLIRMLNQCIKEPHTYMAVMYINKNGTARIDFIQNMEYKFVELLSTDFIQSPQELTRQHIMFRFLNLKMRYSALHARLLEVEQAVKLKNPSLLLQIQKTPSASVAPSAPSSAGPASPTSTRRATLSTKVK